MINSNCTVTNIAFPKLISLGFLLLLAACSSGSDSSAGGEGAQTTPLTTLDVTGTGISLYPAFDPTIFRYSIVPTEQSSQVSIAATAPADTSIFVGADQLTSDMPIQLELTEPGAELELTVVNADSDVLATYGLVYLPVGFPSMEISTIEPSSIFSGDLFVSTSSAEKNFNVVMDNYGVPKFIVETAGRSLAFLSHPNGQYSYNERLSQGDISQENVRVLLDENFEEVDRITVAPPLVNTNGHDFLILPNGNYLFQSYEPVVHDGVLYEDSVIQEVDSVTGEEVFQWSSWGVIPLEDQLRPDVTDYAHMNSMALDNDNNFLVSLRGTSQIVKIDRQSGEVLWKLGGISNEFTINDPMGGPCGQHTISRLASGNILLFDNGIYCPPDYPERAEVSRVVEYSLDEENKVATLVWSYTDNQTFSRAGGSAQRLDNGNTLVGWGGRSTGSTATEVDANGEVVYDITMRNSEGTFIGSNRVMRY